MNVSPQSNLIIIGASGHGKVLADIASFDHLNIFFWDDDATRIIDGYAVLQRSDSIPPNTEITIGIGNNEIRAKIAKLYPRANFKTLIHPKANLSKNLTVGFGTVFMVGSCINPGVTIGEHCIINTGAVVDHDCILEDFVHIAPNATLAGNVTVRKGTFVGAGAVVIQGIEIGKDVIIGAGTVVIDHIPDRATVVGNPGRVIKIK